MCKHTYRDYWACCLIEHPETPDQHYMVEKTSLETLGAVS